MIAFILNISGQVCFARNTDTENYNKREDEYDIFDSKKANLSKMTSEKEYIDPALHKANIEFSNEGIKAAAAVAVGGAGSTGCGFEHDYDVPLKFINVTVNKPYMYLVRDKNSGEVWFTGTVYQPVEFDPSEN